MTLDTLMQQIRHKIQQALDSKEQNKHLCFEVCVNEGGIRKAWDWENSKKREMK